MKMMNVGGRYVHYALKRAASEKPTFIFANSLGTDFRIWSLVANLLEDEYNLLFIDKPGHGLSQCNGNNTTAEELANDVIAIVDHEGIKSATVVGLSIGGLIAHEIYRLRPDLVERLVLTNTASKLGTGDAWNARISSIEENGLSNTFSQILQLWFSSNFKKAHPDRFAYAEQMLSQSIQEGYIAACTALRDADLREQAKKIDVPTLCIAGSDDKATPEEMVRGMADNIPGSQFAVLDGVGHIPCLEDPENFCKLIVEFVSQ